jgi:hypothetical protein
LNYQETINEKRATTQQRAASQGTLDALINQLKEVQLATLVGNSKSTVVLADSSDFGEKIDKMSMAFDALVTKHSKLLSEASQTDQQLVKNLIAEVRASVTTLRPKDQDNSDVVKAVNKLSVVVGKLNLNPDVTVKAPAVTVHNQVDMKPLELAIQSIKIPEIEFPEMKHSMLDDYRAQDIIDDKDKQYVGFLNPHGAWYIIENDIKGNKLRYVFGAADYEKAFKSASNYQYELLDKALNAAF